MDPECGFPATKTPLRPLWLSWRGWLQSCHGSEGPKPGSCLSKVSGCWLRKASEPCNLVWCVLKMSRPQGCTSTFAISGMNDSNEVLFRLAMSLFFLFLLYIYIYMYIYTYTYIYIYILEIAGWFFLQYRKDPTAAPFPVPTFPAGWFFSDTCQAPASGGRFRVRVERAMGACPPLLFGERTHWDRKGPWFGQNRFGRSHPMVGIGELIRQPF